MGVDGHSADGVFGQVEFPFLHFRTGMVLWAPARRSSRLLRLRKLPQGSADSALRDRSWLISADARRSFLVVRRTWLRIRLFWGCVGLWRRNDGDDCASGFGLRRGALPERWLLA